MSRASSVPTVSADRQVQITARMGGTLSELCARANPDTVPAMARHEDECWFGTSPTLSEVSAVYPANQTQGGAVSGAVVWLCPQLTRLSLFSGAQNMTPAQVKDLAETIAAEFHYLKITELMLFFHRFKSGRYGRFYGSADPLVITTALREFCRERGEAIAERDRKVRQAEREEWARRAVPMPDYVRRTLGGLSGRQNNQSNLNSRNSRNNQNSLNSQNSRNNRTDGRRLE